LSAEPSPIGSPPRAGRLRLGFAPGDVAAHSVSVVKANSVLPLSNRAQYQSRVTLAFCLAHARRDFVKVFKTTRSPFANGASRRSPLRWRRAHS
jgi:hypothetical protein